MTAIVFPHVYCNDGIITDLSGYGCIPGNLGLPEKYQPKGQYAVTDISELDGNRTITSQILGNLVTSKKNKFTVSI
ncbi:hypothetical protein [Morganella morganii]|uniref:hypothetical protein n=1 Tax=Morganella morganii TaxID=582 RepID=UPI001C47336D|nr:hypothetical protein [Morganella morganii]QXO69036.1 hypothetical protein JC792_19230 [Morganella morganii]